METGLPAATTPVAIADWLEQTAIASPDQNASSGDLAAVLGRSGGTIEPDAVEALVASALGEIAFRVRAAGAGYPFDFDGAVLKVRDDAWATRSSYLLCLSLTQFGLPTEPGRAVFPERMFEEVCACAAAAYVSGTGLRFGHPRKGSPLPGSFQKAVGALTLDYIREGGGYSGRTRSWVGDEGLDVVAWRELEDGRTAKVILLGACATGGDWEEKVYELNISAWKDLWLQRALDSQLVRAFFVPFRLDPPDRDGWSTIAIKAGLPFDRCRIARWAPALPVTTIHGDTVQWSKEKLRAA